MKRTTFALVFALVAIGAFAAGAQEDTGPAAGFEPAPQGTARAAEGELTTLTGTYEEVDGYPAIRVEGKLYSAGVPGYRWLDTDVEPGEEVTVEGYLFEQSESTDGHIRVSSVELDGDRYDIGTPGYGPGHTSARGAGYGGRPRGGMHGMSQGGAWNTPQSGAPRNAPQNAPRQRW